MRWKFWGWKGFRHQMWQITSDARKSNSGLLLDPSPSLLRRGPKLESCPLTEEELRQQFAKHKALVELNAPETSAPAESSSLTLGAVYGAPQTCAKSPPLIDAPMAGIPPFPPLMSGFPPGYVILSTSLSLGSHVCGFRPPPSGLRHGGRIDVHSLRG